MPNITRVKALLGRLETPQESDSSMPRPTVRPVVRLSPRPKSSILTNSSRQRAKPKPFCIEIPIGKNDVVSQLIDSPHHLFRRPRAAQRDSLGPGP